jgi:hypothetical protein
MMCFDVKTECYKSEEDNEEFLKKIFTEEQLERLSNSLQKLKNSIEYKDYIGALKIVRDHENKKQKHLYKVRSGGKWYYSVGGWDFSLLNKL